MALCHVCQCFPCVCCTYCHCYPCGCCARCRCYPCRCGAPMCHHCSQQPCVCVVTTTCYQTPEQKLLQNALRTEREARLQQERFEQERQRFQQIRQHAIGKAEQEAEARERIMQELRTQASAEAVLRRKLEQQAHETSRQRRRLLRADFVAGIQRARYDSELRRQQRLAQRRAQLQTEASAKLYQQLLWLVKHE